MSHNPSTTERGEPKKGKLEKVLVELGKQSGRKGHPGRVFSVSTGPVVKQVSGDGIQDNKYPRYV